MLETTRGIVLHYNRFGDDRAVVDIFTLSHGSLSFLVRDARQRKKSLHSTLLRPLNAVELVMDYKPHQSLHRIKEVRLAHCYRTLPYEPMKEAVALFLSEFLHNALKQEVKNEALYHYIIYSLQWFDTTTRGVANFHIAFLMRLTFYLGIRPRVDSRNAFPYFDMRDATPTDVAPLHGFYLKGEEAAALPALLRMNLRNIHLFRLTHQQRGRILNLLTLYYRLHVPEFRELRSLAVLREVMD